MHSNNKRKDANEEDAQEGANKQVRSEVGAQPAGPEELEHSSISTSTILTTPTLGPTPPCAISNGQKTGDAARNPVTTAMTPSGTNQLTHAERFRRLRETVTQMLAAQSNSVHRGLEPQACFENNLLRHLISTRNLSLIQSSLSVRQFAVTCPEALLFHIPSQQDIFERVLTNAIKHQEAMAREFMRQSCKGTLVINGWKKVANCDLLVFSFASEYKIVTTRVVDNFGGPGDHRTLHRQIRNELDRIQDGQVSARILAICLDVGVDVQAVRTSLQVDYPGLPVVGCFSDELDILFYRTITSAYPFYSCTKQALNILCFVKTDSASRRILRACHPNSLFRPSRVRLPSSFYLVFRQLLGVELLLQRLCDRRENPDVLPHLADNFGDVIKNQDFWHTLRHLTNLLEPLALATHLQQGFSLRLDDVLLVYGSLYHTYRRVQATERGRGQSPAWVDEACNIICGQLEALWSRNEQELLMAAVITNPFVGPSRAGFVTPSEKVDPEVYLSILERIHRRLYGRSPRFEFGTQFRSYLRSGGTYSQQNLKVDTYRTPDRKASAPEVWAKFIESASPDDTDLARFGIDILTINPRAPHCPGLFSEDAYASIQVDRRLGLEDIGGLALLKAQAGTEKARSVVDVPDANLRPDDSGGARAAPGWRSIRASLSVNDLLLEPETWFKTLPANAAKALQPEGVVHERFEAFVHGLSNKRPLSLRELFKTTPHISSQTWAFAKQDLEDERLCFEQLDSNFGATG